MKFLLLAMIEMSGMSKKTIISVKKLVNSLHKFASFQVVRLSSQVLGKKAALVQFKYGGLTLLKRLQKYRLMEEKFHACD